MSMRDKENKLSRFKDTGAIVVLGLICMLVTWHAWHSEFTYPDAARHAMDGVFVRDFLTSGDYANPWQYALSYYGRYPSVAFMLYYPPGYAMFEAPLFLLFGVSLFTTRLAALLSLFALSILWYLWISRLCGRWIAFWGTLFAITSIVFVRWAGEAMLEIPALALLTGACLIYSLFLEKGGAWRLILTAVLFGLAIETKQTSGFLLPALVAAPFFHGGKKHFNLRNISAAVFLFVLICAPVGFVTLKFGGANLAAATGGDRIPLFSPENWLVNLKFLATTQAGPVVAALAFAGIIYAVLKRDKRVSLIVLFFASNYLAFSVISYKSSRLSMFWVPAAATLAVYVISEAGGRESWKKMKIALVLLLLLFQVAYLYRFGKIIRVNGYRDAAHYIVENSGDAQVVMVQAYHNGNFIFHIRELDSEKRIIVLRSSKMLYSSAVMQQFGTRIFAKDANEILEILKRLGAKFVVLESRQIKKEEDNNATRALRELVRGRLFSLKKVIPIKSSDPLIKGVKLNIYEFLECRPIIDDYIEIDLMSIGRKVKIPVGRRKLK